MKEQKKCWARKKSVDTNCRDRKNARIEKMQEQKKCGDEKMQGDKEFNG